MRSAWHGPWLLSLVVVIGCGEDDAKEAGSGGSAGSTINIGGKSGSSGGSSSGGSSSAGSSTGGKATGGQSGASTGGTNSGGASGGSGGQGANGTQPIGGLCANDANCSQSSGAALCCKGEGCQSPCMCLLAEDCPSSSYLPCESDADCDPYGGGKVCCVAGTMHYCTKPSGCAGQTLP